MTEVGTQYPCHLESRLEVRLVSGSFATRPPVLLAQRSLPDTCERSAFLERRLFEEPMEVAQDRLHVSPPCGPRRDVDAFAEERGVQRVKTSPKLDGLHGR